MWIPHSGIRVEQGQTSVESILRGGSDRINILAGAQIDHSVRFHTPFCRTRGSRRIYDHLRITGFDMYVGSFRRVLHQFFKADHFECQGRNFLFRVVFGPND